MNSVDIHCDGSFIRENNSAGAGIIISSNNKQKYISKRIYERPDCMRAELTALLIGLQEVMKGDYDLINIYTDSLNTVNGVTGSSRRKSNRDLWEQIEEIFLFLKDKPITITHVDKKDLDKSDKIYAFNVKVDQLAFRGANSLI